MVCARARAGRGPPAEAGASGVSGEMTLKGRKGQPASPGHSGQKEPHVARFLGEDRGGGRKAETGMRSSTWACEVEARPASAPGGSRLLVCVTALGVCFTRVNGTLLCFRCMLCFTIERQEQNTWNVN